MKSAAKAQRPVDAPKASLAAIRLFAAYSRRYLGSRFHSLRILTDGLPPRNVTQPLVIYLNHASWWDPLVCLLLARQFFPGRTSFAPIDAEMLERYRFFNRLGFFPVGKANAIAALRFLATSRAILASSGNALWLTPQGRFMDVRQRPLQLQHGLGALAMREPGVLFLPLAIEYSFWTESRPEILVAFGEPIVPEREPFRSTAEWTRVFTEALEATQDDLATRSCRRSPADWWTLVGGKSGVGGVYDAWRWLRARLRGERFLSEHQPGELR